MMIYIYIYEERERKNDGQTNSCHVTTRVKYGDASFLRWFKSICNPEMGIMRIGKTPNNCLILFQAF